MLTTGKIKNCSEPSCNLPELFWFYSKLNFLITFRSTSRYWSLRSYLATFEGRNNCGFRVWAPAVPGGGRKLDQDQTWSFNAMPARRELAYGHEQAAMEPLTADARPVTVVGSYSAPSMDNIPTHSSTSSTTWISSTSLWSTGSMFPWSSVTRRIGAPAGSDAPLISTVSVPTSLGHQAGATTLVPCSRLTSTAAVLGAVAHRLFEIFQGSLP
ncbi:hypothetical protein FNV43_RR07307 [Rhamnella rubrinervis]|uniref:Uncharacterized protein n=1 Tax=Rhamnella rubrinervis TaxID=2594499 RepID=A0A8K0HGA2_9ROSA|nr:hypothetical protein FNV43_RR07307 [Rhamnella rubrinervis]